MNKSRLQIILSYVNKQELVSNYSRWKITSPVKNNIDSDFEDKYTTQLPSVIEVTV